MTISVIVPAYNAQRWVAGCIEGLLAQTHRDLEIIVIDDGSQDATAEIAARYPVKLLRQANSGQSVARNRGLEAATGDYVHFLDVDDVINSDFYAALAAFAVDGTDVVACEVINEPNPHRSTPIAAPAILTTVKEKMRGTNVGRWSYVWRYLFRREFLLRHGLQFEPGRIIEDMAFSLAAIYFANRVAMAPGAVYTYKLQPGSSMTTRTAEARRRRHRDLRHARELRHRFAREHGFRIPGVPTRLGFLSLLYVKWLT